MTNAPPDPAPAAPDGHGPPATAIQEHAAPRAADEPLPPRWLRTRVLLTFLMAGPPLGTFLVAAPILLIWSKVLSSGDALTVALMMALMSYIPGALPALLTGALVARHWPHARGWYAHARIGMAGLLLSLSCLGAAFALLRLDFDSVAETATLLLLCSLPGLVGATLVSRLLQALR